MINESRGEIEMVMCAEQEEVNKIPIYDGMDLEDVRELRKHAMLYLRQKRAMEELKAASEGISEDEKKKLGW